MYYMIDVGYITGTLNIVYSSISNSIDISKMGGLETAACNAQYYISYLYVI
jgi:hypothetical protein